MPGTRSARVRSDEPGIDEQGGANADLQGIERVRPRTPIIEEIENDLRHDDEQAQDDRAGESDPAPAKTLDMDPLVWIGCGLLELRRPYRR